MCLRVFFRIVLCLSEGSGWKRFFVMLVKLVMWFVWFLESWLWNLGTRGTGNGCFYHVRFAVVSSEKLIFWYASWRFQESF